MTVDWYLADLAVRVTGGLLFITCACLLFSLLKCASEAFGTVRGHATGNSDGSDALNEGTTTTEAGDTAHQGHAVRAAEHVIARAGDRSNVRPEHVPFYDFVTAAARAVLGDLVLAETVGKQMKANVWREPSEADRRRLAEPA
jgi:hypothetical protein